MASPTTTLPSAMLAAIDGEAAHASASMRHFHSTVRSGIGSAAPMLVADVTVALALPFMEWAPVLVEA